MSQSPHNVAGLKLVVMLAVRLWQSSVGSRRGSVAQQGCSEAPHFRRLLFGEAAFCSSWGLARAVCIFAHVLKHTEMWLSHKLRFLQQQSSGNRHTILLSVLHG